MDTVQPDMVVDLKYVMRSHLPDGFVKEHPEEHFSFIFGIERQAPTLEKALEGCRAGRKVSLTIPDSEIYGKYDPSLIREIPKKGLIKQRLKEGQFYRQMKMGSLISFKVLHIRTQTVLADFNKPMAGIWISMELEVLGVREASQREMDTAREAHLKRSIGCG